MTKTRRFRRASVRLASVTGAALDTVDGWELWPWIAHRNISGAPGWTVTHSPSGLAAVRSLRNEQEARTVVRAAARIVEQYKVGPDRRDVETSSMLQHLFACMPDECAQRARALLGESTSREWPAL